VNGWLSTGEASKRFGVSRQTIRVWIARGEIRARQNPGPRGAYRIPIDEVERVEELKRAFHTEQDRLDNLA
jgi:excisionase family DNA binding protein